VGDPLGRRVSGANPGIVQFCPAKSFLHAKREPRTGNGSASCSRGRDRPLPYVSGQRNAAPRTPLESPWRGGTSTVSTRSENT